MPALAAAASAAVRTVLREVGLVMVVTPGRMRKRVVCGCRAIRCRAVRGASAVRFGAVRMPCGPPTIRFRGGSGQRFGSRRRTNMGLDHWHDLRRLPGARVPERTLGPWTTWPATPMTSPHCPLLRAGPARRGRRTRRFGQEHLRRPPRDGAGRRPGPPSGRSRHARGAVRLDGAAAGTGARAALARRARPLSPYDWTERRFGPVGPWSRPRWCWWRGRRGPPGGAAVAGGALLDGAGPGDVLGAGAGAGTGRAHRVLGRVDTRRGAAFRRGPLPAVRRHSGTPVARGVRVAAGASYDSGANRNVTYRSQDAPPY